MGNLIDIAAGIMATSENRLEYVSQNVANTGTVGYKKQVPFSNYIQDFKLLSAERASLAAFTDYNQGKLTETKNPLDMAVTGPGFFKLRADDNTYFSRQGLFHLGKDGSVLSTQGHVLQQASGGDLVLGSDRVEILQDGTILEQGRPIAQVGLYETKNMSSLKAIGGTLFQIDETDMDEAKQAKIHQGMVEAANITLSDEMIEMMGAIRQAEIGARLIQVYDTLLGQAISTFGQGSQ